MQMKTRRPKYPTDEERRAAFRELVKRQDEGMSVPDSRVAVRKQFELTPLEVLEIEREGCKDNWPPLT